MIWSASCDNENDIAHNTTTISANIHTLADYFRFNFPSKISSLPQLPAFWGVKLVYTNINHSMMMSTLSVVFISIFIAGVEIIGLSVLIIALELLLKYVLARSSCNLSVFKDHSLSFGLVFLG